MYSLVFSDFHYMSQRMTEPKKKKNKKKKQKKKKKKKNSMAWPRHPLSLIRVFAVRSMGAKDPSFLHADSKDSDQTW